MTLQEVILFGSYATGDETRFSDIDIAVKGVPDIYRLRDDLDNIKTLKIIDVLDYDNCLNSAILEDINEFGVKLL